MTLIKVNDARGQTEFDAGCGRSLITNQLGLLEFQRDDGRVPSINLLNDIKAYKWLLQGEGHGVINSYLNRKRQRMFGGGRSLKKTISIAEVCKSIGWKG